jgi:hypothetical protein
MGAISGASWTSVRVYPDEPSGLFFPQELPMSIAAPGRYAQPSSARRSTALRQLACMQSHDLLSVEEFGRFSSQTRGVVQNLLEA